MSLEDAIRVTKVKVDMDEQLITVERDIVSRGSSIPPIGDFALQHLHDGTKLSYDGKFWKGKCDTLPAERQELESIFLEKMRAMLEKYDRQCELLRLLEKKAQESTHQIDSGQLCTDLAAAEEKLRVYETLTSMTIDITGEKEYTCKIKNPSERKGTIFQVALECDSDNSLAVMPRANASLLPSYLRNEEIIIEPAFAPMVLRDTLLLVFPPPADEAECVEAEDPTSVASRDSS
jgi:hypothetical protein